MRAGIVEPVGEAPVTVGEWPDPEPVHDDDVVVAIRRAALNRNDALLVAMRAKLARSVVGSDGVGVVVRTGPAVTAFRPGDEVVAVPSLHWGDDPRYPADDYEILGDPRQGTHAELLLLPERYLRPRPATLTWEESAALPLAGLTAWRALVTAGGLRAGDRVLVTGASGGVSTFLVQIAAALGAEVHVTTSSAGKVDRAVRLGASGGVDYRGADWEQQLRKLGPFDLVVDSSGSSWDALLRALRPAGTLVTLGKMASPTATVTVRELFWGQRTIRGSSMGTPDEFDALLAHVAAAQWRPVVDSVLPLGDYAAAYARLDDPAAFGKVVLAI